MFNVYYYQLVKNQGIFTADICQRDLNFLKSYPRAYGDAGIADFS